MARKLISIVLALCVMMSCFAICGVTASAATAQDEVGAVSGGQKIYFKPSTNWKQDNARFAMYYFNNSYGLQLWKDLDPVANVNDLYWTNIPAGSWEGIIFVRMNPATTENNWDNKWNQTADITSIPSGKNMFTCSATDWDNFSGTWSTYTVPTPTEAPTQAPTVAPTQAPTQAPAGNITVYFTDALNWGTAKAYYWGTSSDPQWPGKAMTVHETNTYGQKVYKTTIPANATGVIFNNGSDKQTVDITSGIENGAQWYTTGGTENGGKYSVQKVASPVVPTTAAPTTTPATTAPATTVPATTVPATTVPATTVPAPTTPVSGNINVYFTDALGWGTANVHYWGGSSNATTWPGKAMSVYETNTYGQKVYKATIPASVTGIIFNGNGKQTVDITTGIENGAQWYTNGQQENSNYKVTKVANLILESTAAPTTVPATTKPATTPVTTPVTTAPAGNITVYFTDAVNWGTANVYYWGATNNDPAWPGKAMTLHETNSYGQKVYKATIPANVAAIVFNGNGNQTVDITTQITDGAQWYTINQMEGANYKVSRVPDPVVPTTVAPTTAAPTTVAPTTAAPTTVEPTTVPEEDDEDFYNRIYIAVEVDEAKGCLIDPETDQMYIKWERSYWSPQYHHDEGKAYAQYTGVTETKNNAYWNRVDKKFAIFVAVLPESAGEMTLYGANGVYAEDLENPTIAAYSCNSYYLFRYNNSYTDVRVKNFNASLNFNPQNYPLKTVKVGLQEVDGTFENTEMCYKPETFRVAWTKVVYEDGFVLTTRGESNITYTGESRDVMLNQSYWNGESRKFYYYEAEVPETDAYFYPEAPNMTFEAENNDWGDVSIHNTAYCFYSDYGNFITTYRNDNFDVEPTTVAPTTEPTTVSGETKRIYVGLCGMSSNGLHLVCEWDEDPTNSFVGSVVQNVDLTYYGTDHRSLGSEYYEGEEVDFEVYVADIPIQTEEYFLSDGLNHYFKYNSDGTVDPVSPNDYNAVYLVDWTEAGCDEWSQSASYLKFYGDPTDHSVPPEDGVYITVVVPKINNSAYAWNKVKLYYNNTGKSADNQYIDLVQNNDYYMTELGSGISGIASPGEWMVCVTKLSFEEADAIDNALWVGFTNENGRCKTVSEKAKNILKAGVNTFDPGYSNEKMSIRDLAHHTFIIKDNNSTTSPYTSFIGYWTSEWTTVRAAAPMSDNSYSNWNAMSLSYGETGDSETAIPMFNTGKTTKITDIGDMSTLRAGRWYIYAVSLDAAQTSDVNGANRVGFVKPGCNNRTAGSKNVLKAKTNEFDGTYNTKARTLKDLENQVFVVKAKASASSVVIYNGEWETTQVYMAGDDDTVTIYFAAPKGAANTTASWDTGVQLYYGTTTAYQNCARMEMTKTYSTVDFDIAGTGLTTVSNGAWDIYSLELDGKEISAIDAATTVGFVKKGSYNRTSALYTKNIAKAPTTEDGTYTKNKQSIEAFDGKVFIINTCADAKNERTSYMGMWH